jgi:hypothetical protein
MGSDEFKVQNLKLQFKITHSAHALFTIGEYTVPHIFRSHPIKHKNTTKIVVLPLTLWEFKIQDSKFKIAIQSSKLQSID